MSKHEAISVTTPQAYQSAYEQGQPVTIPEEACLFGRIARYYPAAGERFDRLAPDGRPITFNMGRDGLEQLPGAALPDALRTISVDPDYARKHIAKGAVYQMAVFTLPGTGDEHLATWNNVLREVATHDPRIAADVAVHRAELAAQPYSYYEQQLPYDMYEVLHEGRRHPEFMSSDRYRQLSIVQRGVSPLALRQLLACEYRLHPTFGGEGYTVSDDGQHMIREYVLPNLAFRDMPEPGVATITLNP